MIVKGGRSIYGEAIGICILDLKYPLIPGNVGNASTYSFPVRIKVIKGLKDNPFPPLHDTSGGYKPEVRSVIETIKELEEEGVRAVVTACGFFSLLQEVVVAEVTIPVLTSPLMLIPLISRMIRPTQRIGVIAASAKRLTREYLEAVGVDESVPLAVAGMDDSEEFNEVIMMDRKRVMDTERLRNDVVIVAEELVQRNRDLGAIVLECSDIPPFAADIQRAVELPVFDYVCFINMVYQALVQKEYTGSM